MPEGGQLGLRRIILYFSSFVRGSGSRITHQESGLRDGSSRGRTALVPGTTSSRGLCQLIPSFEVAYVTALSQPLSYQSLKTFSSSSHHIPPPLGRAAALPPLFTSSFVAGFRTGFAVYFTGLCHTRLSVVVDIM